VRRGIYGGSFDPIHLGHVAVARAVLESRGLDRVDLIPAAAPPHKRVGCVAEFHHRLVMARLATEALEGLAVLDLEGGRPGPSFTLDTLQELRRRDPGHSFELLVGADMLADLPSWHRAPELVDSLLVVAFARPGRDLAEARTIFEKAFPGAGLAFVETPFHAISSTEVRRGLETGLSMANFLHPAVLEYVCKNRLYGTPAGG
jgi:nicotinate-nucleotide adenylyltransferase